MDFLRNNRRFSLLYGGKNFWELDYSVQVSEDGEEYQTVYTLPDGFTITNIARKYGKHGAYEWVNRLENTGSKPTQIISELWDCKCEILFTPDKEPPTPLVLPNRDKSMLVYAPTGSAWRWNEFYCDMDAFSLAMFENCFFPGDKKSYKPVGGRSSDHQAPYFNIHKQGEGVIFAIGWTGQWNCELERNENGVVVSTKLEDTNFRLFPGEKIRTSSIVMMPYTGTVVESQNKWRRLLKEHFSLIGQPGRDEFGPLTTSVWGAMRSADVLERLKTVKEAALPYDYIWMDAGWFGSDANPSTEECDGDWWKAVGDWTVNTHIHPNGLQDVAAAVKEQDKKFLLWFEPERSMRETPIAVEFPEYFLSPPDDETNDDRLLNLGNPDALDYCYRVLVKRIEELQIDCYRQDFNISPLPYWRKNDAPDRQGITEIKHIMGLYRLWDALLERFPQLLIDNCASGGRRADIEMQRRSIMLWRSDASGEQNFPEILQSHTMGYSTWMPYSGTCHGKRYDDAYYIRSSYAPALGCMLTMSAGDSYGDDPAKLAALKGYCEEYLKVRPYLSCDFYPLTEASVKRDTWCAWQYNRPEQGDGIVQVFRRENSPFTNAAFTLGGLSEEAEYIFTDADDSTELVLTGKELAANGFQVFVPERRMAKLYFYRQK